MPSKYWRGRFIPARWASHEEPALKDSRARALWLGSVLLLALPVLILIATAYSETGFHSLTSAMRVALAELGVIAPPEEHTILKLRLFRAVCALGVGGSLALAGALSQGLFRNPLAEPGLLGIGSGATLGAVVGIAVIGGYGPNWAAWIGDGEAAASASALSWFNLALVPVLSLFGALATAVTIYRFSTRRGRLTVSTLLLTGLAINSLIGAVIAGLQVLLLEDWQVSRAILSWGFGTLDDRTSFHLLVVYSGVLLALAAIPLAGLDLDLLAGGEEDAAALGANPARTKSIVLVCVALATSSAICVSGQIAFVGMLVPHVMRMIVGPRHRVLLPLAFLAGGVLLLSVVVLQHAVCPALADGCVQSGATRAARIFNRITSLQPGVLTSLMGAPVFLWLLLRQEKEANLW
jgi:iron complex transport system permease protein